MLETSKAGDLKVEMVFTSARDSLARHTVELSIGSGTPGKVCNHLRPICHLPQGSL